MHLMKDTFHKRKLQNEYGKSKEILNNFFNPMIGSNNLILKLHIKYEIHVVKMFL